MSTNGGVFKGDIALLGGVNVDGPLAQAERPRCEYYMTSYGKAAQQAEERNDANLAATYRFLQVLVSFHLSFDTPDQPFVPWFQMEGKRALIPSDLSAPDVEAVRELVKLTKDPSLRARLFDVIWELTKDHTACGEAAKSYIEAAERLNNADDWTFTATCYHRGLHLAATLGPSKDLFKSARENLQKAAKEAGGDADGFRCCRLMELLFKFRGGDPVEFAAIAANCAARAKAKADHYTARAYYEAEADWHTLAKNPDAEKTARLAAGETYVEEAANRATGQNASALAAASILTNGIEALRRAGAAPQRIEELREQLGKYQRDCHKEMHRVSTSLDISKLVESAREHVKDTDLRQALFKFSLGHALSDPKQLREEALELAKQFPMTHLFGTSLLDEMGRPMAKVEGLHNVKGDIMEEQLEAEMFSNAARFHWHLRVSGYIDPARLQILNDHHPSFHDLSFVVRNNPFVPPGHEAIFLRGIHAGFHGDFVVVSHFLVPQIENSLRYVLESNGVDITNLMSDGTQPVKVLGAILGIEATKKIFGEPLCFELRGHLIEKTAYNFRNMVAHGFVSEAQCYSDPALNLWWLVLRICLTPVFQAAAKKRSAKPEQSGGVNAG
jgi:hypothetical protein